MPPLHRPSVRTGTLLGLGLLLVLGFVLGEVQGWPWLVQPLQERLAQRLQRRVQLLPPDTATGDSQTRALAGAPTGIATTPATGNAVRLQLWGGLALHTPWLEVGVPAWSQAPYLVSAHDVELHLRYIDVWRAWRGQSLTVRSLRASQLEVVLERRADGQTNWQGPSSAPPTEAPHMEAVDVPLAHLRFTDAQRGLDLQAQGTLTGHRLTLQLNAKAGQARLSFNGHADDMAHWDRVQGRLTLQGPSLAAMGAPLGVSLPTTAAFKAQGQLKHGDRVWDVVLDSAQVGRSQLSGTFHFDTRGRVPVLSGTLVGERLNLLDLGPALGVEVAAANGAANGAIKASAKESAKGLVKARAKVLPSRPFDLVALRAMDADLAIAIRSVDLNTALLEPLRPLKAHLLLENGVLTLKDIDARTSQGHLAGTLSLNGQQDRAHWVAVLQWEDVALERWLHLGRRAGLPPYVTGKLQGHANLVGDGRSTAEILSTLHGQVVATVEGGSISHLLVELGGLDAAQALGLMITGDKPLALDCAVADLAVSQGSLRPRVLVFDTSDSTAWIDGTVSLATESLDLRAIVAPKDLSPLTLRAPLHVGGTFAAPTVSVEKGPLGAKLGSALLLGLLNPLAALIPLVDTGNSNAAKQHASTCQAHLQKKLRAPVAAS